MSKQNKKNRIGYTIAGLCSLVGILLILVVIALCAGLVIPELRGYTIYNVITGSMSPTIPAGSMIYVADIGAEDVQDNDVIAYYSSLDAGGVITHRVVKNDLVNGQFVTKGDANEKEDPTPVAYENLIGEVVFAIPVLGNVLTAMTTSNGKIMAACIVALGAILNILGNYIREKCS